MHATMAKTGETLHARARTPIRRVNVNHFYLDET